MSTRQSAQTSSGLTWLSVAAVGLAICAGCGDSAGDAGNTAGAPPASAGSLNAAAAGASSGGSAATAGASATGGAAAGQSSNAGAGQAGAAAGGGGSSSGGTGGSNDTSTAGGGHGPNDGGAGGSGGSSGGGGSSVGATIVPDPSWVCGKADGIVDPVLGELVFRSSLEVGAVRDVGATQYGMRRVSDIKSGTISSAMLEGSFLSGGIDFELTLTNGSIELEQVAMLRAKDGALIYLRSCGVAPAGQSVVRFVPDFEVATSSSLAWLNSGNFVGTRTLDAAKKTIELAIYDVSKVTPGPTKIQLEDPTDSPNQPWECAKPQGTKGAQVFTESVTLGASLSVGSSKRGTRNVIPITGGTTTGKLSGSIVGAGADYQLIGGSTTLDARYVLAPSDGELVVVRNCGPFGALIPQFEARAAGPYAFLNTGKFQSSDPGSAGGGVSITFFESK